MRNRKRISVLMVLAMVMTLLAGLAAPAGATTPVTGVVIGHVPTVVSDIYSTLASIRFAESGASIGNIQTGNTITVTLPSGVIFQGGDGAADLFVAGPNMGSATAMFHPSAATTAGTADNSVTLTVYRNPGSEFTPAAFTVTLPVNVTTLGTGPINVTITTNTTAISGGTFAVGTFDTSRVTVDGTGTVGTVSRFVPTAQLSGITIRLRENAAGAFRTGAANRVVLTLPAGVTWADSTVTVAPATPVTATRDPANPRRLFVQTADDQPATTSATMFTFRANLIVTRLAELGDLTVEVAGTSENAGVTGSVVLARVAEFALTVRRPVGIVTPPAIDAGRRGPAALTTLLELVEETPGTLIPGGTITLSLPTGVQWEPNNAPRAVSSGVVVVADGTRVSGAVYSFTVSTASAGTGGRVTFSFPIDTLLVSPAAAAGDVTVTVGGTGGAAGTAVVATIRPTTVTAAAAAAPVVGLATTGQAVADVTITETAARGLRAGSLTLALPAGVLFSATPTVARPTGNITLGTASLNPERTILTIPVSAVSTAASVITVSGIRYDVTRTAMDGPVPLTVGGDSFVAPTVATAFPVATRVANATVGVVAPPANVFTIGALSFVRAGVTTPITVAPTIVEGRTLLALRYAALAVGVSPDDIIWDSGRRTVTLLRGDRVVQLRIGDKNMTINGVIVPIDVPAIIQNGRSVLPIGIVARALRAGIAWDATARTVTVTP